MQKPDIHEYLDLRQYLNDIYSFRKKNENGFSYAKWAEEIGFRSRAYLRAMVTGEKPLHESLLAPLITSLKLTDAETDYLTCLLKYSTADTKALKDSYARQLLKDWKAKIHQIQITDISEFLADPLIPVIFTYLSFSDVSSDANDMAKSLNCDIERIRNGIRCLIWQKLIDGSTDNNGQIIYKTIQPFFSVPSMPNNSMLKYFHMQGIKLAEQAMEKPSAERKSYATFVAMNDSQFAQAQELIQEFNTRLLAIYNSKELEQKKIYRINSQIFPAC